MEIYIQIKHLKRRKVALAPVPVTIPDEVSSLRDLLTALVEREVCNYNHRAGASPLFSLLPQQGVEAQAEQGKVGFGRITPNRRANLEQAVQTALQGWEDGLVRVFLGEQLLTDLSGKSLSLCPRHPGERTGLWLYAEPGRLRHG